MSHPAVPSSFRNNVPLSEYSTIGLGGPARIFSLCTSVDQIRSALDYARQTGTPVQILAGGSNIIFPDEGFDGLVLSIALRGIKTEEHAEDVIIDIAAGEPWDAIVARAVEHGWAGLECLSGIPGTAGATPIQNVGAYGQEIAETLCAVIALDRTSGKEVRFEAKDCRFGYRQSRFKGTDRDRYIITCVRFRLLKEGTAAVRYPELQRELEARGGIGPDTGGRNALRAVRQAVLAIRRRKSMVIDPQDEHSRSVGSFFTNPVVSRGTFETVEMRWSKSGGGSPIPTFPVEDGLKIPAAWLVERSGYPRGFRQGGVGISARHALALVNYGGTTSELLMLAETIREKVRDVFGITLEFEPVVVKARG
jgi:UDP-N-acetylmuramate dehydrogenase